VYKTSLTTDFFKLSQYFSVYPLREEVLSVSVECSYTMMKKDRDKLD